MHKWVIDDGKEFYLIKKEDQKLNVYEKIRFDEYPIPFLLMYCDNVQEWGRQIRPGISQNSQEPTLNGVNTNRNEIVCTLLYTKQTLTQKFKRDLDGIINPIKTRWSSKDGALEFVIKFCGAGGEDPKIAPI